MTRAIALIFLNVICALPQHVAGQTAEPPTPQKLDGWIKDLGDSDFSKRQFAMIQLNAHKAVSIPKVIQTIETSSGEQADQLLQFLGALASNPYDEDGQLAYQSLTKLATARTSSKGTRAQKILQVIGNSQRDEALAILNQLGVQIGNKQLQVGSTLMNVPDAMVINGRFRGVAQDLQCLKWISQIEFVCLYGPNINRDILKAVLTMKDIKRLQLIETPLTTEDLQCLRDGPDLALLEILYTPIGDDAIDLLRDLPISGNLYLFGTNITMPGKNRLKTEMDTADVFVSRGAFLGVKCQPSSSIIEEVPPGGAAIAAGLRRGDRLLTINGTKIGVFEDLRRELSNFAAEEEVEVEYERISFEGTKEKLSKKVKLGKRTDLTQP